MNEYQIEEKMAVGSFGVAFKVRRSLDDSTFVMKRISLSDFHEQQRRDAAQEILVMSSLHHPFIVAQRDAFLFNEKDLCIVMDYYDGGDLDAFVAQQRDRDEYLPLERVMTWFASICLAVQYIHKRGILHRDLKTQNIFLDLRSGEVAIGDFGLAEVVQQGVEYAEPNRSVSPSVGRAFAKANGTSGIIGGAVRGTPLYMAPEVLEHGVCSQSSDVWSLGCILYELLSLRHPFESRDIAPLVVRVIAGAREQLPNHYPPELVELVDRMLALDPAQRPSCEDILQSSVLRSYVHMVALRHVPRDAPDSPVEKTFSTQLEQLGVCTGEASPLFLLYESKPTLLPSEERRLVERKEASGMSGEIPLQFWCSSPTLHDDTESISAAPPGCYRILPNSEESDVSFAVDTGFCGITGECSSQTDVVSNVEDMRDKPLAHIEQEVAWYRQLVQTEMRLLKQQRDATQHQVSKAERGICETRAYQEGEGRPTSWLPTLTTSNTLAMQASMRFLRRETGQGNHSPRGGAAHLKGGCGRKEFTLPQFGTLEASLVTRRRLRWDVVQSVLGTDLSCAVYEYYRNVEVAKRDTALMKKLVPDREQWYVLPVVEEVLVIDRLLDREAVAGAVMGTGHLP